MYGLINSALRSMVCEQYGHETWQQVLETAELSEEHFFVMKSYPDDITHKIVNSATQILNLSGYDLMESFGRYWIRYTKTAGYQEIMDMCGETLPEFLSSLDDLHTRLGVQFPKFSPPSFECNEVSDTTLELHYRSTRQGLAPMVVGLVQGLGDRFETNVDITQIADRAQGDDCDTFLIHYDSE
jgi:hypothetical protein